ncbi:MAG: hypothetical protein AAFO91_20340, partial [Bacteroidota bacterium]
NCSVSTTLTFTVIPTETNSETLSLCANALPFTFGTQSLTAAGTYTETFTNTSGCDSVVTLTLTIDPDIQTTDAEAICDDQLPFTFGTQSLTTGGTYVETFLTADGCDSTVTLTLTVNPTYTVTDAETICSDQVPFQFGTQSLSIGGTYTETFSSVDGCDSVVTLTLTVDQLPVLTALTPVLCESDAASVDLTSFQS